MFFEYFFYLFYWYFIVCFSYFYIKLSIGLILFFVSFCIFVGFVVVS